MERAVALAQSAKEIDAEHLALTETHTASSVHGEEGGSLNAFLAEREKSRVLDALRRANGNQTQAAKLLGVSRRTIITKIEAFGIDRPRKDRSK
jgi:transcriptional regulator with PAS, ATPase and Fis domain